MSTLVPHSPKRRAPKVPLRPSRVSQVMTADPETVESWTRAEVCERLAAGLGVHHLVVSDHGRLVGVLCRCDLKHAGRDDLAGDLMTSPAATIDPLAPLEDAAEAMNDLAVGCLPVVAGSTAGERLVGIVSRGDLVRAGLGDHSLARTCACCGTRCHLEQTPAGSEVTLCRDCVESGRALSLEGDPDDWDDDEGETPPWE